MLLCCEKDAAPASSSQHGNAKFGTTRDKAFDFRTAPAAISLGIHLPPPERVLDSRLLNVGCPTRCAAFLCKDFAIHCGALLLSSSLCVAFRSGRPYLRVGPTTPSAGGPKESPPEGSDPLTGADPGGCHSGATPYGPGCFLAGTATGALSSARGTACVRHLQPSRDTRANVCANQSRAAMLPPEPRDFGAQPEWFIPLSIATSPVALLHPVVDADSGCHPLATDMVLSRAITSRPLP